jgi:hypothetical protein
MSKTLVTAADVRAFFQADPKRMAALTPEAAHTVAPKSRGNLHPEAIALHNKRRRNVEYVKGASKAAAAKASAEAKALRAAAAKAGHTATRGPIPKSVLAQVKG